MVRKVRILLVIVALLCATGTVAHATSYTVYDGTPSSTYIQYFRDIVSGIGFNEHYVAFRSGQYEYTLVVGDLEYDNGNFSLASPGTAYTISIGSNYNTSYSYAVSQIEEFSADIGQYLVYSDLGQFPQLIEIGEKYEILQTFTLCAVVLFSLFVGVFRKR